MSVKGGQQIVLTSDYGTHIEGPSTVTIPALPAAAHPEQDALDLWQSFLCYNENITIGVFENLAANVDDAESAAELKALRARYSSLTKSQISEIKSKSFEDELTPAELAKAKKNRKKNKASR